MKKLALALCAGMMVISAFAQGIVNFSNIASQLIRTNSTSIGGTAGSTAPGAVGSFYFGLFIAEAGTVDLDLSQPIWTFTGVYATNTAVAGRLSGGPISGVPIPGWVGGTYSAYMVAGWSANLGHDWSDILPQYNPGYQFGFWNGLSHGFFGQSVIGRDYAGGGPLGQPVPLLFGAPVGFAPPLTRSPVQGFDLYYVPEPTSVSLAALGAALLHYRRRKSKTPI